MKVRLITALALVTLSMSCVTMANASQITVDFDNVGVIDALTLSNNASSQLAFGIMQIHNGAVTSNFVGATSAPNVYAVGPVAASNLQASNIEMNFSSPVSDVGLDVITGGAAGAFTVYAFDASGNILGVNTVNLNSGGSQRVWFNVSGISEVVVRGVPGGTPIPFAVDTIQFSSVPEPASLMLMGTGIAGLWGLRKRLGSK